MERAVYDVLPGGGRWRITLRGETVTSFVGKAEAITHAVYLARTLQPSQVVLRRADGSIERKWTYGDGPALADTQEGA